MSDTDPDSGMFYKRDKERSFCYSTHTACDASGMVLGVKVTSGNVHDSRMLLPLVDDLISRYGKPDYVVVDSGYKSSALAHSLEIREIQGVMPYRNRNKSKHPFRKSNFNYCYDTKTYTCPNHQTLKVRNVLREGYIVFRCDVGICEHCKDQMACFSASYKRKEIIRHIWEDALDRLDDFRKTAKGRLHYSGRKETIERVFADAKEQHGMRYTRLRGLQKVTEEVYLTFACMNLKKMMSRLTKMRVRAI